MIKDTRYRLPASDMPRGFQNNAVLEKIARSLSKAVCLERESSSAMIRIVENGSIAAREGYLAEAAAGPS